MAHAARLIAFAGLCGAGKTTAVNYLAEVTGGEVVYFGATILAAVKNAGLPPGSASEQKLRISLRGEFGPAYLAMQEGERIKSLLEAGALLFVDAIYVIEEFEYLSILMPSVASKLMAIDTAFENRIERLKRRSDRPLCEREVMERDAVERMKLKTGNVFSRAELIDNNGDIAELQLKLRALL